MPRQKWHHFVNLRDCQQLVPVNVTGEKRGKISAVVDLTSSNGQQYLEFSGIDMQPGTLFIMECGDPGTAGVPPAWLRRQPISQSCGRDARGPRGRTPY